MGKAIPDRVRQLVFEESDFQCAYCGHRELHHLTVHHIIPREQGGEDTYDNLIVLCHNCHNDVRERKRITDRDVRRIKRHLVFRYLTQAGVNALKIAYQNPVGVAASPYSVQHLVERGLLKFLRNEMGYGGDENDLEGETIGTAIYQITNKGKRLTERWLLSGK